MGESSELTDSFVFLCAASSMSGQMSDRRSGGVAATI